MSKGDYLKFNEESIKNALESKEYIYCEGEYKNRESKIVVMNKEGYMGLCRIGSLMNNQDVKFFFSKNPYTLYNIELWISKNNLPYKLLSKEYINSNTKMAMLCPKHGVFYISWNKLLQGQGCPKCANNIKYTLEEVKNKIKEVNPNIEILSTNYINAGEKLECLCLLDGHKWKASFHNLYTNKTGCPECKRKLFIGENNHRYNHNLTEEERIYGRNIEGYSEWRKTVYERDKYTCQCCGSSKSGTLNAHHLNGYHWSKEERLNVDNGITLCENCHKKFHSIYGYENNTKEQFQEFLNNYN